MEENIHQILQRVWGYDSFRPLQEDIITSILAGRDTLGLLPTGGGKSITFQVPALARSGVCIVVTPLVALMKDQVDNLKQRGIKAAYIHAGMSRREMIVTLENCIFGQYKFLYVSPERLYTELFQAKLQAMQINFLVVDEAHCISQWGYDFRPSYLRIAEVREQLVGVPVLALTATATPEVVVDIQNRLQFKTQNLFRASFYRPNLTYVVREGEDKMAQLIHILKRVAGSAIVYARSRIRIKEIAEWLTHEGFSADYYHAGLTTEVKNSRQQAWKEECCRVIVATNAFGMGIDKPNVRVVIHYDLPNSPEEYYQEAGRAGRDGERAYAIALYAKADKTKLRKRVSDTFPARDFIKEVYQHLGSYLQIAVGAGMNGIFDFNIFQFCQNYHLPSLPTYHALKILGQAGYIEYVEEVNMLSRVTFTVQRDELYRLNSNNPQLDELIQVLLRSYTGLFADYVTIQEDLLERRCGLNQQEVYEALLTLTKQRILDYVPRKRTPYVLYTSPREDAEYVSLPKAIYEDRKQRFEHRIESILGYVESRSHCRTDLLLRYFGENFGENCHNCDLCIGGHSNRLDNSDFATIQEAIFAQLSKKSISAGELTELLPFDSEVVIECLRYLCNERFLTRIDNDKYQLSKQ